MGWLEDMNCSNSEISSFKLHRAVTKRRNFSGDGVYPTLRRRKVLACAIKNMRLDELGENLSCLAFASICFYC